MADESDWEESYMLVELDGVIDNDWINKSGDNWKIIGIETETPLLQMNRYVFTGTYDDTVGTDIIFEVSDNTGAEPERQFAEKAMGSLPLKNKLSYSCHMYKRLHMKRTFLSDKEEGPPQVPAPGFPLTSTEIHLQAPNTVPPEKPESSSTTKMDIQTGTSTKTPAEEQRQSQTEVHAEIPTDMELDVTRLSESQEPTETLTEMHTEVQQPDMTPGESHTQSGDQSLRSQSTQADKT